MDDKLEQKIIDSFIDAAFGVIWYNYDDSYICETIKNVKSLINLEHVNETSSASFIYQELVLLFGDYGTSPRRGWLDKEYRYKVLDAIEKYCHDMRIDLNNNRVLSLEEDDND